MTNQSTLVADNHEDHGERSRTDAGSQALGMAPSTNKGARPAMLCLRELSSEPEANGGKCVVAVDGRSQIDGDQADAAKLKDYLLGYCVSLAPATPGMYKFGAALQ